MFSKKYGVATLSFLSSNKKTYGVETLPDINKYKKSYSILINMVSPFKSDGADYGIEVSPNSRHKATADDISAQGIKNMTADSRLGDYMVESSSKQEREGAILAGVSAQRATDKLATILDALDALKDTRGADATIQSMQAVTRVMHKMSSIVASQLSHYVDERDAEVLDIAHHLMKDKYFETIKVEADATNSYQPSEYRIDIVENQSAMRLIKIMRGEGFADMLEGIARQRVHDSRLLSLSIVDYLHKVVNSIINESLPFQGGGIRAYMPELIHAERLQYLVESEHIEHYHYFDRRPLLEWLTLHEPDLFDRLVKVVDSRYTETDWGLKPRTVESTWWTSDFTYASYRIPEFDARYLEGDYFNRSADMMLKYARGEYALDYDQFVRHNVERWSQDVSDFHNADLVLFGGVGVMINDPDVASFYSYNPAVIDGGFEYAVHNMTYEGCHDEGFDYAEHTHRRDATMIKDADLFTYEFMTDAVINGSDEFRGTGIPAYLPEIVWGNKLSPDAVVEIVDYTDFEYSSMQLASIYGSSASGIIRPMFTTEAIASQLSTYHVPEIDAIYLESELGYRDDVFDSYAIEIGTNGVRSDVFATELYEAPLADRVTVFDSLTLPEDQYGERVVPVFDSRFPELDLHSIVPREFNAGVESIYSTTGNVSEWFAERLETVASHLFNESNFATIDDVQDALKQSDWVAERLTNLDARRIDDRNYGIMEGFTDAIDNGLIVYMHELHSGTRLQSRDALLESITDFYRDIEWSTSVATVDLFDRWNGGRIASQESIDSAVRLNDRGIAVQPDTHLGVHNMTYDSINDEHFDLFVHNMWYDRTMFLDPQESIRRVYERPSTLETIDESVRKILEIDSQVIEDAPYGIRRNEQYAYEIVDESGKIVTRTFDAMRETTSTGYRYDEWLMDISNVVDAHKDDSYVADIHTFTDADKTLPYLADIATFVESTKIDEYLIDLNTLSNFTRIADNHWGEMTDITDSIDSGTIVYLHEGDMAERRDDNLYADVIEYFDSAHNAHGFNAEVIDLLDGYKFDDWIADIADFRPATYVDYDYTMDLSVIDSADRDSTWERVELVEGQGTNRLDTWLTDIAETQLSDLDKDRDAILQLSQSATRNDTWDSTIYESTRFDRISIWSANLGYFDRFTRLNTFNTSEDYFDYATIDREWNATTGEFTLTSRSDEWVVDLTDFTLSQRDDEWDAITDVFDETHRVNEWSTAVDEFLAVHRVNEFATELITTQLTERMSYKVTALDEFVRVARDSEWDAKIEDFTGSFGPDDREYTWLWHSTPYAWSKWNWYKTK